MTIDEQFEKLSNALDESLLGICPEYVLFKHMDDSDVVKFSQLFNDWLLVRQRRKEVYSVSRQHRDAAPPVTDRG